MKNSIVLVALATALVACATHKEKIAPCKRPSNLSAFVDTRIDCGEAKPVNSISVEAIETLLNEDQDSQ